MQHTERLNRWATWQEALDAVANCEYPDTAQAQTLAESLRDIQLRDALLAEMGHRPDTAEAFAAILGRITIAAPESAPALAFAGALEYLRENYEAARDYVSRATWHEPAYSLAAILSTGLMMKAPASLLRRSFTNWQPVELLEGTAAI